MDAVFYRIFYVTALFLLSGEVAGRGLKEYNMEDQCGDEISMIFQSIFQGRLKLDVPIFYQAGDTCMTHIETWITGDRIMFYFDHLDIPCNEGYLEFFDDEGPHVSGLPDRVCGSTAPTGTYAPSSRTLSVKYTTRNRTEASNSFAITFTTFRTGSCFAYEYKCDNGRCIKDDINCNGHNPCGDNSDCHLSTVHLSTLAIVGIVIGGIVAVILLVSAVVLVYCCKRGNRRMASTQGEVINMGANYTDASGSTIPVSGYPPTPAYNTTTLDGSAPPPAYNTVFAGQQPVYPSTGGQQTVPQYHKQEPL